MPHPGEQFLHQKDPTLHISANVEHERERLKRKGEETSQKPADKISDWLDVIKRTHTEHRDDPRVLERIKENYHKQYVIKQEDIPESYYNNQKRLAREQGHGDIKITEAMKEQLSEVIISDQESTLDNWVDYLSSPDADAYPMWAKYWAFNSLIKLSTYDKEKHAFAKRDKTTVAPFPDINREALAYVVDAINKKANNEKIENTENNLEFKQLLDGANFGKLYVFAIEKVTPTEENELVNTKGEWIKYKKEQDHMPLVQSLQGYGTGWCTAGESTAQAQLKSGDFYVYYSNDKQGQPTIPRVAIRMQNNNIAEVRGIAPNQNLDSYITDVVKKKMQEFPDGKAYEKKASDMKQLTNIENKANKGQTLTRDDLIFLYEIDKLIQGFGYQTDPRIKEIRDKRNLTVDASFVLECEPNQIAYNQQEITKNTKVYIGPLFLGIFKKNLEHIYTSFPEGKIHQENITIGGKDKKELEKELKKQNIQVSKYTKSMMESKDFTIAKKSESINLIKLKVKDLGLKGVYFTIDEVYTRAKELGLELCQLEVGLNYRLQYTDQLSFNEYLYIGMKQIFDSAGDPHVVELIRASGGLKLRYFRVNPASGWDHSDEFVFRLRK